MRPHTTIFSGAFLALCLIASNGVAANTSPSQHLNSQLSTLNSQPSSLTTKRPAPAERLFVSDAVEKKIREIKKRIKDNAYLAWMFENCFPNTLDTTVHFTDAADGEEDTFVYTGDIHAMWLRD